MNWQDLVKDKTLSIIVPVYNEGDQLESNIRLLLAEVVPFFQTFEVIIANDGSTDQTKQVLERLSLPNVRQIQIPVQRGKGFALREGARAAYGDYVFFIDGGMELHPKEIRIFVGMMLLYNADIVMGSKRHPQSEVYYPLFRRALSFCYQLIIQALFKMRVTDTQVGLKLIRSDVLRAVLPEMKIDSYGFDLELLMRAQKHGFHNVIEAPIKLDYFKMSKRKPLREMLHVAFICVAIAKDTLRIYAEFKKR